MINDKTTTEETNAAKQETGGGWMRRLVREMSDFEKDALLITALQVIDDLQSLIGDSDGVYGLHLNGDPAPWSDLTMGGKYEEWLHSHGAAECLIEVAREKYGIANAEHTDR